MIKTHALLTAAITGLLGATASADAPAAKVQCYGIAQAGHNACGHATGLHGCAGLAKVDKDPGDWVSVSKAECDQAGGKATVSAAQ